MFGPSDNYFKNVLSATENDGNLNKILKTLLLIAIILLLMLVIILGV